MAGDIKQKIVLEGEKEYSAALKAAQRNLKTLRSELKAETAELGANATAQQKNEAKVKNLQKQIKEQEKVVKTYREALDEVKSKYGDNEEAVAKWEQKLNDARATLANMKNSIQDVGNGMKAVEGDAEKGVVAANSFADSLQNIASVGDSISGSIEHAFTSVVGTIREAITALWDELMDVAARANDWQDIAGYWGTSASNIQKWYHAVEGSFNSFGDLSNAVTKIVTGDQEKIAEVSGVSAEIYSDKWEYAMAVMDSLAQMSGDRRLEAVGEIFGDRRSPTILNLLNDWKTIHNNLGTFDANNGGYGLSEEKLRKASQLAEDVAKLRESWQALQDMAVIQLFGDLALNVTGNLQNIVDAFKEYFQAETDAEKQAAIQKIKDNIVEMFTHIKDAIKEGLALLDELAEELKDSPDATARQLGEVLSTITGALSWFTNEENWKTVQKGFEALIGVWAAGKVASAVGNIASFAANVLTIKNGGKWLMTGASAFTPAAGAATALSQSAVTSAITSAAGPIAKAIAGVTMSAGIVLMAAPVVAALAEIAANRWPSWLPDIRKSMGERMFPDLPKEEADERWNRMQAASAKFTWKHPDIARESAQYVLSTLLTGQTPAPKTTEEKMEQTSVQWGARIPSMPRGQGKIDATAEQRAAAEAFWDVWRSEDTGVGEYNEAFAVLKEAYGDNIEGLDYLMDWMEKLYEAMEENLDSKEAEPWAWEDLPSSWWLNNNDTVTGDDISGLRTMPGQMRSAVKEGMSGVKVTMDGQTVGRLVAPYVSQYIARDLV